MVSDQTLDPNFVSFLRFYTESYRNPGYEAEIRAQCLNTRKRVQRKQAEALVTGYRGFDSVRESVVRQFREAAAMTPMCRLLPILNDLDRSFECTFVDHCGEFECCITGKNYQRGKMMTLLPDPENPFGPAAKTYKMRSDFEDTLTAYRNMARFRYTVMKHVTNHEGCLMEDNAACQKLYDIFLQSQKWLLATASGGQSI